MTPEPNNRWFRLLLLTLLAALAVSTIVLATMRHGNEMQATIADSRERRPPAKGCTVEDIFGKGEIADARIVYPDPNSPATATVSLDQRGVTELFSNLTREPNPLPWAIIATVEFRRNDRGYELLIFKISDEELGVRVDNRHYFRGLKMSAFMSYKPDE
jgi:hypothetical protein